MKKKLTHNLALKLASLVLAFILWFLVVQIDDPSESTVFYSVPVTLTNTDLLEAEDKVYEVLDGTDSIRVTVRGPRSIIKQLRSDDIVAEADMSRLTEVNTIAISLSVPNAEVDSVTSSPDVVRLRVEDKATKWVRVQYSITGEVAENYMIASATPDQTIIEVSGPESSIEQISYAGIEIDVSDATTSMSANLEVSLFDSEGNLLELSNVKKNVNYVRMSVEVLATKEVPIELDYIGEPADGYLLTGVIESDPSTVTIAGTSSTLSGISKISIPAEELDISGATEDVTETINIKDILEALNVQIADSSFNGRINATVHVEPVYERTFEIADDSIEITNLPEGIEAEIVSTDETQELTVSGLEATVKALHLSTLNPSIDVSSWMEEEGHTSIAGHTYTIPVSFTLDEEITQETEVTVRVIFNALS